MSAAPLDIPPGSALVIVDLQEGFMDEATAHVPERVAHFLDEHGDRFETVVATRFVNRDDSLYRRVFGASSMTGPPETDLVPELAHRGLDVIEKDAYGVLAGPLCRRLHERGDRIVYLCGVDTEQCVLKTALDCFDAGIEPVVLADLCASSNGEELHEAALGILERTVGSERVLRGALPYARPSASTTK